VNTVLSFIFHAVRVRAPGAENEKWKVVKGITST